MDFGLCVAPKVDEVGFIAHAENLGYKSAWFSESHLNWSDPFICAALAAQQTRSIQIGVGVLASGLRLAPAVANAVATVNRIAPGRTFASLGMGTTSWRTMGHAQIGMDEYEEYVRVVKGLIAGEEVDFTYRGRTAAIRFAMPDLGFIDVDHEIPMAVSAGDRVSYGIAGKYADIVAVGVSRSPGRDSAPAMEAAARDVSAGADSVHRALSPDGLRTAAMVNVVVLEPGESLTSERVLEEAGPLVLERLHEYYAQMVERPEAHREEPFQVPAEVAPVWEEYVRTIEATPERGRALRTWRGHCMYVHPDEARFITPELVEASVMIGSPDELIERMHDLDSIGLDELILLPPERTQYRTIDRLSQSVLVKL